MPPASKKHVLVCIICLKRVEIGKVENIHVSFGNSNYSGRTLGSGDKNDPLFLDDSLSEQDEGTCKEKSGKTNLYRRFLQFINQYFKLRMFTDRFIACANDAKSEDGSPAELETFCASCGDLVSEICGLYKQLRSAELILGWRLGQVGELIGKSKTPRIYKFKKELWSLMAKQMNLNVACPVHLFRKTLKIKCLQAAMRSLPDVTVHRGLFPDEWKFTYAATKQALIRLIVVFILGSSQFRSKPVKASIDPAINKNDESFGNQKPCPKSKKNLEQVAVKSEPGNGDDDADADALTENVVEENEMPDNLGNHSDSDWSQGVAAAGSPMSACSDLPFEENETGTSIQTRGRTSRNRRNIIVKAEEDGDTSSGSESADPTAVLRKGRSKLAPLASKRKSTKSSEKGEIKCPHCPFLFKEIRGLCRHLRCIHRTTMHYDCNKCGMRFKGRRPLLLHSKVHMPKDARLNFRPRPHGLKYSCTPKPTPCPKCAMVFPTGTQMRHHQRVHHNHKSTRHECPYCFRKIFREKTYQIHLSTHEQKIIKEEELDIRHCEVCGMQFFKEENLKFHMNKSHDDKYVCTVCNEKLDTGKLLRDHLISHHETEGDKPFHCHLCLKEFTTKQYSELHRKLAHMDKWKFVCDFKICYDIFDTISEFNEHLKTHLDDDGGKTELKIFNCKICNLGFLEKHNLTLHELLHTPRSESGTGYDCPKCDKNLRYRENLFAHYNAMHGKQTKPFRCEVCKKYLSHARWFRAHVRRHEDRLSAAGKFICDICGIRCVDSIGLSAHSQNHEYNPETRKTKDAEIPVDLAKKRKTMKLIWQKNQLDLLLDPTSPPPPGAKKTTRTNIKKEAKNPDLSSSQIKQLNLHVRLSCDVENCGIIFDSAFLLRKHLENEHECKIPEVDKSIQCYYCHQRFYYQQSRELHVRNKHKNKIYGKFKCDLEVCEEEAFHSVEELNNHVKTHLGTGGITEISPCGTCDWQFVRPEVRDFHCLSHIPPDNFGRFQCPLCSETYSTNFLFYHYNKVHGGKFPPGQELKCNLCDKICSSKGGLKKHKNLHLGKNKCKPNPEKQLTCFMCDILFKDNVSLMAHVKELHPDNYHTCGVAGCEDGFTNKKSLWLHMKSKHKSRTFVCDLCGMAFYSRQHLAGHMKTHKPKSVPCDICGQMFQREVHMERHKWSKHNPNKSPHFVCSVCGKAFFAKGGLTYHFDSAHKPESEWHLKCPKCPRRFYRAMLMHMHTKKCDGSGTTKDEKNYGDGGRAGSSSRKRGQGQPRKGGGRQKKKRIESDEEEEEMEDKSTTEDDEEIKPSSSSSGQTPRNEFQNILTSSSSYQQQSEMWAGQSTLGISPPVEGALQQRHDGLPNFPPIMPYNQQQLQQRQDME